MSVKLSVLNMQHRFFLYVSQLNVGKFQFQISIFASFWLVNDTGIPLIFKQEGTSLEMAGQFDEHEMARSLTPLLFSFDDRDGSFR